MAIDKGRDSACTETYRLGPVLTSRHARGRMTGGDGAFVVEEPAYAMQEAAGQVSVEWKVTKQSGHYQYPGGSPEWLAMGAPRANTFSASDPQDLLVNGV